MPKFTRVTPVAVATAALLIPASLTLPSAQSSEPALPSAQSPCSVQIVETGARSAVKGKEAVAELTGKGIDQAARVNGMNRAELFEVLTEDPTAKMDECGRLLYAEPVRTDLPKTEPFAVTSKSGLNTSVDAFALESRPGAPKTVYLDFNGVTLTQTGWNSYFTLADGYVLSPYDLDGNSGSFSNLEKEAIKQIWLWVAEDFAPFNINVTTKDPGLAAIARSDSSDNIYGTTVAITNDTKTADQCGCGGLAWVNVIGITPESTHTFYQPALVYASNLTNGYPQYVALAASHEAGHNFGLRHDGTSTLGYYSGQGAWGPIMGAPYSKPVTTWSNGDYANANNKEDDLSMIAAYAGYVADDHANTSGAATNAISGEVTYGVIEQKGDTDWFTFTAGGDNTTVSVSTQNIGPNLDTQLEIYDAAGEIIATVNPPASLNGLVVTGTGASHNFTTEKGATYTFKVSAVGEGNPLTTGYSDYGSLGRYTISLDSGDTPLSVQTGGTLPGAVSGSTYERSLSAAGGVKPYAWSVTSGTLPSGLSLSSSGLLSGIPVNTGSFSFRATVTDGAGASANKNMTLRVSPALTVQTPSNLSEGTIGFVYRQQLTAGGGLSPYAWSLDSGNLPAGLSINAAGLISGTPTAISTASFRLAVTDSSGNKTTRSMTLKVTARATIDTSALPQAKVRTAYSHTLAASGGTAPYTWSLAGGKLPSGLSLTSKGIIRGTPAAAGTWNFTVSLKDSKGRTATKVLKIVVRR